MARYNMKLSEEIIYEIVNHVEDGLTDKDAALCADIGYSTFALWKKIGNEAKNKSRKTKRDNLCLDLVEQLKKARILRKKRLISSLEEANNVTATIFLLKNYDPKEFNKKEFVIGNFDQLEKYMEQEYTQDEIDAVRKAIIDAEQRKEREIEYDEEPIFNQDGEFQDEETS